MAGPTGDRPTLTAADCRKENEMTTQIVADGWYVLFPEGGAWVAVRLAEGNMVRDSIEECNAETHITARDTRAHVCEAIADSETDIEVTQNDAAAVIEAANVWFGLDWTPERVAVERIRDEDER